MGAFKGVRRRWAKTSSLVGILAETGRPAGDDMASDRLPYSLEELGDWAELGLTEDGTKPVGCQ